MTLNKMKNVRKEGGFTIVELLIVIVIIAILATITIVAYNGITNRAKLDKAIATARNVVGKAEAYNAELGSYPTGPTQMTSAASSTTYYLTGATFVTAIAAAPSNEATIMYSTCTTPAGIRISYWDFQAPGVAHLYTGGATTASTCTATVS